MTIVTSQPKETTDIRHIVGLLPLFHSLNLGGINSDSLSSKNMAKKGNFFKPELAFAELGI
jgi:hypothetical protein